MTMEAHLGMICSNTKLAEKARRVADARGDRRMLLDPVYKREEIARMMGISRTTLWRWLKERGTAH